MIKLIYGEKGTGKTKQIIDKANEVVQSSKGNVVFITDVNRYMFNLVHKIRLIDANEYDISSEQSLVGFIRGLIAGNSDIQYVFIDGAARMIKQNFAEMENFYLAIDGISQKNNISFFLTVSENGDKLPKFMKKYM